MNAMNVCEILFFMSAPISNYFATKWPGMEKGRTELRPALEKAPVSGCTRK
jgi:hypothetical protein